MSKANKNYSENAVIEAIEAIKNENPLHEATSTYGVPKSTISDRMANPNDKRGRPTILSDRVDRDLADWLRFMAAACMPVTRNQFAVALAQSLTLQVKKTNSKMAFRRFRGLTGFRSRFRIRLTQY
jgi:hypothetical protein